MQLEMDSSWNLIQSPNSILLFFKIMTIQTEVRLKKNIRSIAWLERIGNLDDSSVLFYMVNWK